MHMRQETMLMGRYALWIYFPAGQGASGLSPSLSERSVDSPVTARNWRTLLKLREMLAA